MTYEQALYVVRVLTGQLARDLEHHTLAILERVHAIRTANPKSIRALDQARAEWLVKHLEESRSTTTTQTTTKP